MELFPWKVGSWYIELVHFNLQLLFTTIEYIHRVCGGCTRHFECSFLLHDYLPWILSAEMCQHSNHSVEEARIVQKSYCEAFSSGSKDAKYYRLWLLLSARYLLSLTLHYFSFSSHQLSL